MRVLISGAGIAGPTLAWFLAKTGARVTVVEKSRTMLRQGQNIDIEGSAISVIKKMGVLEEVRRFNTTEKGTRFIDPSGRPFAPFPVPKPGESATTMSPTSELEILRGDLALVLYEATKELPQVKYEFGITISKVVSNDEKTVKVELSNGEVQEYDVLVAADGQWSNVRKQCFPLDAVTTIDKGMYGVYWTIPRLPSDNDWWNVYQALGSRILTIRPDPHGTVRAAVTRMPCNEVQKQEWLRASRSDRQTQEDLVRKEFADAGWQAERLLGEMPDAPDFYFQACKQIKMSSWSTSRVVCLGDAAHAPTPLSGFGTSLAIMGAYVLAGELSKLSAEDHPSKAFAAYESTFRPFVEEIQNIPFFIPGIAHPGTAWKRWLFQSAVLIASKVLAIKWVASKMPGIAGESTDVGFQLPHYLRLEDEATQ
ncbi:hypothetical protein LTR85_005660 [Meristemomyces frigidus]|nr:hypothetical protein LTR85_005660 [Meristemomyces frigidus]